MGDTIWECWPRRWASLMRSRTICKSVNWKVLGSAMVTYHAHSPSPTIDLFVNMVQKKSFVNMIDLAFCFFDVFDGICLVVVAMYVGYDLILFAFTAGDWTSSPRSPVKKKKKKKKKKKS